MIHVIKFIYYDEKELLEFEKQRQIIIKTIEEKFNMNELLTAIENTAKANWGLAF